MRAHRRTWPHDCLAMYRLAACALIVSLSCVALLGTAWGGTRQLATYRGADAGWLIVSTAECPFPQHTKVSLGFQRMADGAELIGTISSVHQDFDKVTLDEAVRQAVAGTPFINGVYAGNVYVIALAPGNYVLNFARVEGDWGIQNWIREYRGLSVPFSVKPGRSVYLGSVIAVTLLAKDNIGLKVFKDWRIVVNNQETRDVPIARRKANSLGPVDLADPNGATK